MFCSKVSLMLIHLATIVLIMYVYCCLGMSLKKYEGVIAKRILSTDNKAAKNQVKLGFKLISLLEQANGMFGSLGITLFLMTTVLTILGVFYGSGILGAYQDGELKPVVVLFGSANCMLSVICFYCLYQLSKVGQVMLDSCKRIKKGLQKLSIVQSESLTIREFRDDIRVHRHNI
jgi:hypothetical protein